MYDLVFVKYSSEWSVSARLTRGGLYHDQFTCQLGWSLAQPNTNLGVAMKYFVNVFNVLSVSYSGWA